MSMSRLALVPVACFVFNTCAEDQAQAAAAVPQTVLESIKQRLVELSAEDFAVREQASRELEKLEFKYLPVLKELSRGVADAEAQLRLKAHITALSRKAHAQRLAARITVDFNKTPLEKVLAELTRQTGIGLTLGPKAREAQAEGLLITLKLKDVLARSALNWVLRLSALGCIVDEGNAVLEPGRAGLGLAYPVLYSATNLPFSNNDLCAILKDRILSREFWSFETSIESVGEDSLCVVQTEEVHVRIAAILAQLKKQKNDQEISLRAPEEPWRAKIREALKSKRISLDFVDQPLHECLAEIQKSIDVALILDPKVIAGGGDANALSLKVADMEIGRALEWVLKLADLDFMLQDEAVFISRKQALLEDVELHILNLDDLTSVPGANITTQSFADMIRNRVKPESWDPNLGTSIEERAGRLFIMQRPEIHDLNRELVGNFRAYLKQRRKVEKDGQAPAKPLDPADVPRHMEKAVPAPAWMGELQAALKKPVTCQFKDTPLDEALACLGKHAGLNILLDPRLADDDAGKAAISLRAKDRPLDSALRGILRQAELEFQLRGTNGPAPRYVDREEHLAQAEAGCVFVTKRTNLEASVKLGLFYVRDLESVLAPANLAGMIKDRWLPVAFADPCTSIEESGGVLVIMQRPEILRQIEATLNALRKQYNEPVFLFSQAASTEPERAAQKALLAKLDAKVTFQFKGTPFDEVIAKLEEQTGMVFDVVSRTAEAEAPIRIDVREMSLRGALEALFEPLFMDYRAGDGVFLVDRRETIAAASNEVGLYRLNGLVGEERTFANAGKLVEHVQQKTGAGRWDPALGRVCELAGNRLLVVHHPAMHAEIKQLFEALRAEGQPNK